MKTRQGNCSMGRHVLAVGLMLGICLAPANAAPALEKTFVVMPEAKAVANPPSITLSWPRGSRATGYTICRKLRAETSATPWGTPVAVLPGTATSWTDTTVSVGVKYEYQITRTWAVTLVGKATIPLTSWGYVCAGIDIPAVDHRGTVILVVDNTMATPLSTQLALLQNDLIGDGWSVIRHDVDRKASVTSVKALVKADYDAAPTEVRSVFLFGHVPVARSGDICAGGHGNVHRGAFPADLYYGDMDGVWTDTTVNDTTYGANVPGDQIAPRQNLCFNVPGDGKFDQSWVPPGEYVGGVRDAHNGSYSGGTFVPGGRVELEVGRVDLSGMTSFLPKTETELLRQYLNKDHAYRHAITVFPRRALIHADGDADGHWSNAESGWGSWSSLFGSANITEDKLPNLNHTGTDFGTLKTESYLGYHISGAGSNNQCAPAYTADIARQDPKAVFWMMFGSHFSDWEYADNILRAPLATSCGLTSVYSAYSPWFLHPLSLGGTFGEVAQLVQNNTGLQVHPRYWVNGQPAWEGPPPVYLTQTEAHLGEVHIALMGDPTLRLHAVKPVTNVTAVNAAENVTVSWAASTDTVAGYHVYRATTANGPFTRVTDSVVTGSNFIDANVTAGTYTYMVRAIKLETSAGGTYYNSSQGIGVMITVPRAAAVVQ